MARPTLPPKLLLLLLFTLIFAAYVIQGPYFTTLPLTFNFLLTLCSLIKILSFFKSFIVYTLFTRFIKFQLLGFSKFVWIFLGCKLVAKIFCPFSSYSKPPINLQASIELITNAKFGLLLKE